MKRLADKVALVTGSSSGIGAATAALFAAEGATVAGFDLAAGDGSVDPFFQVDVRDEAAVEAAVAGVVARCGRIDVLVNAAGVSGHGPAHLLEAAEFDRVLDVNLKGSFLVAKHVLRDMLERGSGAIVNVASIEGLEGMSQSLAYNASKGGVVLMTRNMAIDYSPLGIRVNCLCPGAVDTPMTQVLNDPALHAVRDQMRSHHLLNRFARPEEIAFAALFLASDEASFVTGTALVVDGGYTAGRRVA